MNRLLASGYERVSMVEGCGQCAMRGSILDVFPPNEGNALRIEFFDTQVDSIRRFDCISQRSIERLSTARIAPATECLVTDREAAAERLREKRRKERAYNRKHWKKIAVKGVVCAAVLLLILYIFVGGTLRSLRQQPAQTETPRRAMLSELLQERGYETENVSLTYRWVVDDLLQAAGGGEKDGNRFELYRYADEETARRAYGQVVNLIAPEMESAARASHKITLTGGGSMFTVILDGVCYLALTRNSDVIYACSPNSLQEANAILADIGYLHGKS